MMLGKSNLAISPPDVGVFFKNRPYSLLKVDDLGFLKWTTSQK
jgi:hypothetical protein